MDSLSLLSGAAHADSVGELVSDAILRIAKQDQHQHFCAASDTPSGQSMPLGMAV